jgi:hypothetical protein
VGAVILADSVWGLLWRLTTDAADHRPARPAVGDYLPYFRTQSPAGRLLGLLHEIAPGATWRELVTVLALTALLGVLLGPAAVVLSGVAWAVILWAWALARGGKQPALCDALLNVGLPWLLGLALAHGATPGSWRGVDVPLPVAGAVVGAAFTVQQWGARRAHLSGGRRLSAAWVGQGAVLLALIGAGQPALAAIAAALFLPPAMWLWRSGEASDDAGDALRRGGPWWLASMLLAAVALR